MASDLSNIFKGELANTLEQLLSKSSQVEDVGTFNKGSYESSQFINAKIKFEFKDISSTWEFYIPTISATKFEFLMLGGMGDLKEHLDDEILDAVNEIISNICGSFATTVNAQGFDDIGSIKSEVLSSSIVESSELGDNNTYEFTVSLDSEKLPIILSFDDIILPFLSSITGASTSDDLASSSKTSAGEKMETSSVASTPNNESVNIPENLNLLYNVKLKLSVRLGTKVVLLKDILSWDVGEIIELEQMVNEPLEILVNGIKIGVGEAVVVEGKFGLKIKKIGNQNLRLS